MELHYVTLFFRFVFNADVPDPYALFACRAPFETAFRSALSCRRSDCNGCRSSLECPYPANFGQQLAKDPEAIKRHQKPPLPFVFRFPVIPQAPNRGRNLECALTLFGSAVQEAERYITAVRILLEGMDGSVLAVEAECPGGARTTVAAGEQPALPLLGAFDPTVSGPLSPDEVSLSFITPLKIMYEGRLLKQFRFSHLARALMRRVSALAYYYEGAEPALDYRWLSQCSESIDTASSDCRFVSWGGRPTGIMGDVTFRGDLEPFHLLLQLGQSTQLGKGASFGFGAYRLRH